MELLEMAAARLALDEQPSEHLPALAVEALSRGIDSPSLRILAGVSPREVREATEHFIKALQELGITVPEEQDALWIVARNTLRQITGGTLDPYQGAAWIWRHIYRRAKREGDLRVFVGLASEWDDHPPQREALEADIRRAAVELLSRDRLRQWIKLQARPAEPPVRDPQSDQALHLSLLPLSDQLRSRLTRWAAEFDRVNSNPGQGPSGFATEHEVDAFVDRGAQLRDAIQAELGSDWHVEYMPTPRRFP